MNAREDWLKARTTGVGGSDVAAILGLSNWKTAIDVYREKRGELPPQPDNDAMKWGRYLEPVVRQAYADETGREVRVPTELIRHPLYDYMIANIDGVAGGGNAGLLRIFEAKTARTADGWGEPGSDQIPQPYLLQVQHYMEVTGVTVADVAVLIGGSDFRLYEVPADRELQEMLIDAEAEFWELVKKAEPPEPVTYADAIARYGRASRADIVMADADVLEAIKQLRELKTQAKHLELAEEGWRAVVLKAMGECDTLVDPAGKTLATWKSAAAPKRFDTAAFKAQHADLYERFVTLGEPSRRFLLKGL